MRRVVAVAVALAAFVAAGGWYALGRGDDDPGPRAGSVRAAGPPVEIDDEPASYRLTYRVEDRADDADDEVNVTTDRVWVRRPFESRLETWSGEPPGREQLSVEISSFGGLATGSVDQDRLVTAVPPGVPASDARVTPMLAPALDAGVVERRERREVRGRPCQVYRSSAFFTAASLEPPTAAEYAETCVDAQGIALEEVLFLNGRLRHRRVAVDIEVDLRLNDELFGTGEPTAEVADGGGSVREADATTRPEGEFWEVSDLDLGTDRGSGSGSEFRHRGRYTVIPPQAENFSDPIRRDQIVAGTSDVWVADGIGFLVVDQGGTLGGVQPFQLGDATPRVDLGDLGQGEVLLSSRGNEVRVLLDGGRYLRIYGTLPPGRLAEHGRRLERTEGTGLVHLPT